MDVVLTGPSGNLGTHIAKHAKFNIIPLGRNEWDNIDNILNSEIDQIIHCAYDLKNSISRSPSEVLDSNILSTAQILEKCKERGIKKFVFISSCSVYGHSSRSSEDTQCIPVTINGLTKLLNESLIQNFCDNNNIEYKILRVFNSYGGDDHFSVVQKIIESAKNNQNFVLNNKGQALRDFIHIDDVAKLICHLLNLDLPSPILNIGTGEPVKIVDILKTVENKLGKISIEERICTKEVEYSRADITILKSMLDYKFKSIFSYIEEL